MIIFDIETDGLLQDVTKVHCLVMQDTKSGKVFSYHGESLQEGLTILSQTPEIGGHNIIGFDLPVLKKPVSYTHLTLPTKRIV